MHTNSLKTLVGKQIASVIVNERSAGRSQIFLVCQGGEVVELYGETAVAKTVMSGGEAAVMDYLTASRAAGTVERIS